MLNKSLSVKIVHFSDCSGFGDFRQTRLSLQIARVYSLKLPAKDVTNATINFVLRNRGNSCGVRYAIIKVQKLFVFVKQKS